MKEKSMRVKIEREWSSMCFDVEDYCIEEETLNC
jgi:hypothetical protein